MKKFKLPRKLKKKLKRTVWFYPRDIRYYNNGYLLARPNCDEEDFKAWKSGILINFWKLLKDTE